jgi:hypothetical protein
VPEGETMDNFLRKRVTEGVIRRYGPKNDPDLSGRVVVTRSKFLIVEGLLQNRDGVVHVKAMRLKELSSKALELRSRDFHRVAMSFRRHTINQLHYEGSFGANSIMVVSQYFPSL